MFNKKQALFLGISPAENVVLKSIHKKSLSIFRISDKTAIPRATVYLIIQKLYRRGFIRVKMQGKRYLYKSSNIDELISTIEELIASLKQLA
jgi:sugar-specific transcriptional regulator TrmB